MVSLLFNLRKVRMQLKCFDFSPVLRVLHVLQIVAVARDHIDPFQALVPVLKASTRGQNEVLGDHLRLEKVRISELVVLVHPTAVAGGFQFHLVG